VRRFVLDLRDRRPVWAIPDRAVEEIRAALPDDWELVVAGAVADGTGDGGGPSPEAIRAVRGAEVYAGYGFPRALFDAATAPPEGRIRWVHSGAAGVGGALYPEMRASGILLTNSAGIHAEPIADTVLGMVLHFARGLDFAVRAQVERRWGKEPFESADAPVREVSELTLGLVGLGGIGRAVARRFTALGAQVLGVRRSAGEGPEGVDLLHGEGALERLLEGSDVVVVTVPETEETRGLLGRREIGLLGRHAVLVNVSRGRVVDEEVLAEALGAGRLRGAALDVFAREPLPPWSPLWGLPNVLVTPHVSGTSHRFWERETALIVENLRRYLSGEPLRNQVDKEAGY
jgi:D-2-hydroxyacid dehydrogenase (NADP+)